MAYAMFALGLAIAAAGAWCGETAVWMLGTGVIVRTFGELVADELRDRLKDYTA